MEFQTLRKNYKKQIIIGAIAVCVIGGALTFSLTMAKYKIANDLELAKGTINYKAYDFKIMAMYKSDDKTNYTEIEEMPSEGYTINEDKSYCNMSNGNKDTTAILKTIDGNHIISKLKKNDKCFIYFDKKLTSGEIIIANSTKGSGTPNFAKTSCSSGCEEATVGTYTVSDPVYNGISTYFRGDVTDNYVKFANFCWRIVRINGDGTIRLIYDGTTCHANGQSTTENIAVSQKYNTSNSQSNYVGWTYEGQLQRPTNNETSTSSNAKIQIENWYDVNIKNDLVNETKVAKGKYCNDRSLLLENTWSINGSNFKYSAYDRVYTNYLPTLACNSGDVYNLKVGLITVDEAVYAGGRNADNTSYYLYNEQNCYTMSPYNWQFSGFASVFVVSASGFLIGGGTKGDFGLRPVINLVSDVTISGGDGTLNNPYVVS